MAITPWQVEDLNRWTECAIRKGASCVVLRLVHPPTMDKLWEWSRRWEGLPWIVHARWASQPLGHGMHFPAPPSERITKPHPDYLLGQSCHSTEEVAMAASWASYVWIGPFFFTPSHPERQETLALESLSYLRQAYPTLPLVALGGIDTEEKIAAVREAGAWGFAAIRYFYQS
ncbi:MAG: thiamine phosphate synthase [Bacteroidia bacterium]|nr:thiamine phosphate synthase [Bacteroidia bacterium]